MKRGLTTSVFAHGALLLLVLFGLPIPTQPKIEAQEAVQVDISKIGDATKVMATSKDVVKKPKDPAATKTEVKKDVKPAPKVAEEEIKAAKPKEPEPEKKPDPPKPEDKPVVDEKLEELLKAEAEAEAKAVEEAELALKKKADEKKKVDEKKKADEKKKIAEDKKKKELDEKKKAEAEKKKNQKLDIAELEELLNKENEERAAPKKSADADGSPQQGEVEVQGDDAEAKATFKDALVQRIKECFSPPPAALDENVRILVEVDFSLNEDGTLNGQPKPQGTGNVLADGVAIAAASAIVECQPYNFFPPGKFKGFSRWIIEFDPKDGKG